MTIEIKPVNSEDLEKYPAYKLNFKNDASMAKEVFPSIFKQKEFSISPILWIDSGRTCKRFHRPEIIRPFMAPIRVSNTGMSHEAGSILENMMMAGKLIVANSRRVRFLITCNKNEKVEFDATEVDNERKHREHEKESATPTKDMPVPLLAAKKPKTSLFAQVSGYVPNKIASKL